MKVLFHSPGHRKNTEALKQMCKEHNIDLEITYCFERIKRDDYDILIMNCHFIEPSLIPSKIRKLSWLHLSLTSFPHFS